MKISHYTILLLFFVSCIATAADEQEADRWYQVEIIIFSHQDDAVQDDEQFPEDPGQPAIDKAIELAPASVPLGLPTAVDEQREAGAAPDAGDVLVMPYQMLAATEFQLKNMATKLARSARYVPLLHIAWRQPAFAHKAAAPVHIHWRPALAPVVQQVAVEALAMPPDSSRMANEKLPPADREMGAEEEQRAYLDGLITVSANRYLHLDFDLLYGVPPPADKETHLFSLFGTGNEEKEAHVFRMVQSRRLRRGEYHYFDHPRFGLIALVAPYSYPVKPENTAPDDNSGVTVLPIEPNP